MRIQKNNNKHIKRERTSKGRVSPRHWVGRSAYLKRDEKRPRMKQLSDEAIMKVLRGA